MSTPPDPAMWGFYGVVVTGIVAILTEQIRSRRGTQNVNQQLNDLATEIATVKERIDDHIRWHLEESRHRIYIKPSDYHPRG